jgi:hypothetical protein
VKSAIRRLSSFSSRQRAVQRVYRNFPPECIRRVIPAMRRSSMRSVPDTARSDALVRVDPEHFELQCASRLDPAHAINVKIGARQGNGTACRASDRLRSAEERSRHVARTHLKIVVWRHQVVDHLDRTISISTPILTIPITVCPLSTYSVEKLVATARSKILRALQLRCPAGLEGALHRTVRCTPSLCVRRSALQQQIVLLTLVRR